MKNILALVLVSASLLLTGGCILVAVGGAAAAGAGTVYWIEGELKETEAYSLERTHTAVLAGLKDMQFAVVSDAKDAINAKTIARTATDTKVQVLLAKQSPTQTEIRIRVGTFGDETISRQLLARIKARL